MDFIKPSHVARSLLPAGQPKADLSVRELIIRPAPSVTAPVTAPSSGDAMPAVEPAATLARNPLRFHATDRLR